MQVEISVEQAQFLSFYEAFRKYETALKDAPSHWGKVAEESGRAADHATRLASSLSLVETGFQRAAHYTTALKHASDATSRAWGGLARHTKDVAGHIKEATASLLKWSGVASIVGSLAGWGGAIGFDALGSHVSGIRTGALRTGTTYGGREAFGINFSRFGDPEGVLGRVAGIQSSADHTALRNLGLSESEIRNMDPADLAALAFQKLRERSQRVNKGFLGDWLSSNRINEVFDLGQALQARSTSAEEMADVQSRFKRDRPRLEMTPKAQLGWTKFVMQLDLSAGVIHRVFAENLAKLTKGLGALSESFSKLLAALLRKDGPLEQLLDGLVTIARWFGITPAAAATSGYGDGAGSGAGSDASGTRNASADYPPSLSTGSNLKEVIDNAAKKYGVDPRVMYGIHAGESGHGARYDVKDDAIESSWGPFQLNRRRGLGQEFERDTAEQRRKLGLGDLRDPRTIGLQAEWVAKYLASGRSLRPWAGYHGNRDWNQRWGAAGLDTKFMSREEVQRRLGEEPARRRDVSPFPPAWRTKVLITKPPGGDLAATANAAARR